MRPLTVLIVGHGSREASSNYEFEALVRAFAERYPTEFTVHFSYAELAQPETKEVLKELAATSDQIVLLPLFLFTSGHVKNDLPLILAELQPRFPRTRFFVTQTLGVHPKLVEMMFARVGEIMEQNAQTKTGVVVVNRGSSDVDANGDFHKIVRIFEEGGGFRFVLPTFIGITSPRLEQSLEMAAKLRPERLLVMPYFLFGGRLIRKIEKIAAEFARQYPWIKVDLAPYFGPDPRLFALMHEKIADALAGRAVLPCTTCEYRQELPGLPSKVGGLRALLWSLRHMETHNQAVPHEFPHRNLKKHILICENVDCANRGSGALIRQVRNVIKDHGKQADFRVTRTSCMGRCGEGPAVVVYPDGIWYQKVQVEDAEELVLGHLFNDRILARLVDNIMQ